MEFNLSLEGLPEVAWNVNTMFCVLSSLRPSFFFLIKYLFIYFWLCAETCGFSLVAASRGYSPGEVCGLLVAVAASVAEPGL